MSGCNLTDTQWHKISSVVLDTNTKCKRIDIKREQEEYNIESGEIALNGQVIHEGTHLDYNYYTFANMREDKKITDAI